MTFRTSSRSTPSRVPISDGELVHVLRDERERPETRETGGLERAAVANGLGHADGLRAAGGDARASTT